MSFRDALPYSVERSRTRRRVGVSAVVFLAAALVADLTGSVPAAAAAPSSVTPSAATITAPSDYFTNQWNDPMDFNNPEDISLTRLNFNEGSQSMNGGRLRVEGAAQIILTRGDPGAYPTSAVRDPRARTLDGNVYTRVSFRMHSDRTTVGAVGFRTCDGCADGYRYFDIVPGWHTYDFDMVGTNDLEGWPGGTARFAGTSWGGSIGLVYLAIAFNTPNKPTVTMDDAWIYAPANPISVTLAGGSGNVELWQDTNNNPGDDGTLSSAVNESANRIGSFPAGSTLSLSSGLFRPNQPVRFYTSQGGSKSAVSGAVTMPADSSPSPVVSSPSELGGTDFAAAVRGDAWDFDQATDVLKTFNTNASVHDSALFGFAAGAKNDPVVLFNLGPKQIDATLYHKVVVKMNYDGPWGLEDAPGGGLVGRFVWSSADGKHEQVSLPIVVKPGPATYVMSFRANPAASILDPTGNSEWIGWGTNETTFVSMLRFDPHEDPGERSWQIDDVKLLKDEAVAPTFGIQFRDDTWAPGTVAQLYADGNRSTADGLGTLIAGNVNVAAGTNTFTWDGSGVGAGPYFIHAVMTRNGRTITASSTGQVDVGMNGAGEPPNSIELGGAPSAGPTQAQLIAFFNYIVTIKFFCGVARARNIIAAGAAPVCDQLLGPWVRPKAKAKAKRRR